MREAPTAFRVPLRSGWFVFGDNPIFRGRTLYPEVKVLVYDTEVGLFIPPITTSGLLINAELHPWVIVRASGLEDADCPYLNECIDQLIAARIKARAERVARVGDSSTGAGNRASGSGDGGVAGENNVTEGGGDGDSTLDGSHMDDGPDIRVIVVFGSNDGDDPDYVYHSGDEEGSEEEGETLSEEERANRLASDEEDEAMETDCEDQAMGTARKVVKSVTDLTWLSDN